MFFLSPTLAKRSIDRVALAVFVNVQVYLVLYCS